MFQKYWYNEVSVFRINLNNCINYPPEVRGELLSQLAQDPKVEIVYRTEGDQTQGQCLKELVETTDEDEILLLEEDAYIFNKEVVNRNFSRLQDCDIVGSPRGSCSQEIWDFSKEKYDLDYSGYGDMGPNWWPNFFFIKRENLLKTDLSFGSKFFPKGSGFSGYTFKEDNNGDTFVWMSMQLRALGLTSMSVPQHKASGSELEDKEEKLANWHPTQQPFEWIHAGSLSSGWWGYFKGVALPEMTDGNKADFETRCAFWYIAMEEAEGFEEFKKQYEDGILGFVRRAGLGMSKIAQKRALYKELMGL